ncbi:MAG: hypothetical protein LBS67_07300 [Clostridiales Family XIII bacterium]|jgi:hypothetical protein|nr:hypothetical protein [Clostridiales Family XIII bacterium]
MARYGTLKRNLRRNIKPWSEDDVAKSHESLARASKVVAVFLALSLSGAFIPLVANIVFRVPDLYSFDLGRTRAIASAGVSVDDDKTADAISSFMRHKTDSLQVKADAKDRQVLLFTSHDGVVMKVLRSFLDNILVIGITSLAVFLALSFILARWNRPRELRRAFAGGFALYGALVCFTAWVIIFSEPAKKIALDVIGVRFTATDMTPRLFGKGFFLTSWAATTVVTLVIMLVLLSVVSRMTKHERMFWDKG